MFFTNKKHKVEKLVFNYLDLAEKCLECSVTTFNWYLENNLPDDEFWEQAKTVHSYESQSDNIRKDIEYMMYYKSLIPESRGDILGILEAVDRIPNKSEAVLREIYQAGIKLPDDLKERFKEIIDINLDAAKLGTKIIRVYFTSPEEISVIHEEINILESKSDRLQIKLTRDLMHSTLPDLQKILLKGLIEQVGQMSNISEDLSDRIKILSVKTIF